jgi:hypothetical protein
MLFRVRSGEKFQLIVGNYRILCCYVYKIGTLSIPVFVSNVPVQSHNLLDIIGG